MKKLIWLLLFLLSFNASAQTYAWWEDPDNKYRLICFLPSTDDTLVVINDIDIFKFYSDTIAFKILEPSYNAGDEDYFVTTDAVGRLLRSPKTSIPQFIQTGFITAYAGSSAPTGYFICDGSAVSRSTYSTLFSLVGTTYGAGNGTTTFNIPDLRQRFPLGVATSGTGSTLGGSGGAIDHDHTVNPPNTTSTASANINNVTLLAVGSAAAPSHTHDVDIVQFNSGTANAPFLAVNYIIKY